jgi:hypothetical protein
MHDPAVQAYQAQYLLLSQTKQCRILLLDAVGQMLVDKPSTYSNIQNGTLSAYCGQKHMHFEREMHLHMRHGQVFLLGRCVTIFKSAKIKQSK